MHLYYYRLFMIYKECASFGFDREPFGKHAKSLIVPNNASKKGCEKSD